MTARVSRSDTSLLIAGETGSGKEWLARWIHADGPRSAGPFVAVNCGAVPDGLFESELFGHTKGSFTGATRDRRGAFQQASGGTLLLDEIGDIPIAAQSKLLRALQENEVKPVGSDRGVPVDVRIIAASNRDLKAAEERGEFRADLFYRLAVVTLLVPSLRERRDEIAGLVDEQIRACVGRLGQPMIGVSPEALLLLESYQWPGNVRELMNVVERAVLLSAGEPLSVQDLPEEIRCPGEPAPTSTEGLLEMTLAAATDEVVRELEVSYLSGLLSRHSGHLARAAEAAGINRRTLYNKMQEHHLTKEEFRRPDNGTPGKGETGSGSRDQSD
ncbi:MAG: sigma-54-dependent Fis family transcriptional regulator [Gemmatimonadetes bacterium]|nr:sigma-54-dependent Fis family transcriptional regulator [Gemmatimonadota bacterium]